MDRRGKGKLSDQMKGKYCIFYEEEGRRVVVRETGSEKTRAREQSRWTVREAKRRWRIRSLLKKDQSWNVSVVCKKNEGFPSALLHGDRLSTTPKKSAVAIRALMKM